MRYAIRSRVGVLGVRRPDKIGWMVFCLTMEAIAKALGMEVAKAKRPRCMREFSYGAFQVSGRLDDGGRHGIRKL